MHHRFCHVAKAPRHSLAAAAATRKKTWLQRAIPTSNVVITPHRYRYDAKNQPVANYIHASAQESAAAFLCELPAFGFCRDRERALLIGHARLAVRKPVSAECNRRAGDEDRWQAGLGDSPALAVVDAHLRCLCCCRRMLPGNGGLCSQRDGSRVARVLAWRRKLVQQRIRDGCNRRTQGG